MNRNLKTLLLYVFLVTLFAALAGCGGGDDHQNPVDPQDADIPDQQDKPDVGNDADADVAPDADAGQDAEPDVDQPDADAEPDVDQPDADAEPDVDQPDADAEPDAPPLPEEICGNGLDDDGNGKADCQDSACSGETACQEEVCNGADDNGNGMADEGFECKLGTTAQCQTSCGSIGTTTCATGCTWSACAPPAEICGNSLDDNCNLATDCDDIVCVNLPQCNCETPSVGDWCTTPYVPGDFHACDSSLRCNCIGQWDHSAGGNYSCFTTEVCNGFDDNGNSQVDEGFTCIMGTAQNCTTSCGSTGVKTCGATCEFGACAPPLESCGNGVDDDCDGKSDCADTDCSGMLACQTEICDGADNNGNGQADEGFECRAGSTNSCSTSCGSAGTYLCSSTCTKGACIAFENCYAQGDEDCDGKADCADPICANLPMCVVTEVCNGLDDNNNGQIDETFQCIQGSAPVSCTASCGSTGTKACLSNCSYGACAPPAEICNNNADDDCDGLKDCADSNCASATNCMTENCTNGVDDNGNNLIDCADPSCFANVACHDFGTCPAQSPSGTGYSCGPWVSDTVPSAIYQISGGCANSINDQWAIGGNWSDVKALHLTGNHTWSEVTLPVAGEVNGGNEEVLCLGQNKVFMIYNTSTDGVFLRWNGSSFDRLMQNELVGMNTGGLWGTAENDLWLVYRDDATGLDVKVFHWNGSSATSMDVNPFAPNSWLPTSMWGSSSDNIYVAGNSFDASDRTNLNYWQGALLHWDGYSWAVVQTPLSLKKLTDVHGSGACDVLATGYNENSGGTLQRNGNNWDLSVYSQLDSVDSVCMITAREYVLQSYEEIGATGLVWMGTPNATGSIDWSIADEDFYYPAATWSIPGTAPQVVVTAGRGNNGPEIRRSTCQ